MILSEGMNVLGESSARVEAIFRERSLPVFGIRAPHGTEVTFDHVGFAYPAKGGGEPAPVLDDVSFTAPAGQITAIVGPSGSGKSTVASLICRFYDAGAGAVRIGGADLRGMSEGELSELVSFVFQESHVFSMSVRDNIRLARPDATDAEVREAARKLAEAQSVNVTEIISKLGPDHALEDLDNYWQAHGQPTLQDVNRPPRTLKIAGFSQNMRLLYDIDRERSTVTVTVCVRERSKYLKPACAPSRMLAMY